MSPIPEADDELLLGVRSGDEQAFVTLYRRRQGAIYRFVLHMTGSVPAAEDVTQEVFLALIRQNCGYDPQRGSLAGYLFGIARKLVLRQLERTKTRPDQEWEDDQKILAMRAAAADPMIDLLRREGLEALRKAVQALPRRYREVVVLCDLEELDYAEAAGILGCPVGTVRSRLHRARSLLLDKLRDKVALQPKAGPLKPVRSSI
jgi:RNA polymerase sigma-70 factor, ECF subfamily